MHLPSPYVREDLWTIICAPHPIPIPIPIPSQISVRARLGLGLRVKGLEFRVYGLGFLEFMARVRV